MAVLKKQKTAQAASLPRKKSADDIAAMLAADMEEEEGSDSDKSSDSDDGEDGEEEQNANELASASTAGVAMATKPKINKESLYRAPTNDELRTLKDSKDLYKSNLFRLKTEEMLKEVKVNYEAQPQAEAFLHKVRKIIIEIPVSKKSREYTHDQCAIGDVKTPLPRLAKTPVSFSFQTPTSVNLVGSYLLRTQAKPVLSIDVAVEMPIALFQEKDFMNYRYHAKRSLYLATVASALKKALPELNDHADHMRFIDWQCDANTPVLELHPVLQSEDASKNKTGKKKSRAKKPCKFVVRIIPSLATDAFSASRLGPNRNAVRRRAVASALGGENVQDDDGADEVSTPHYNAAVLRDMYYNTHMTELHHAIEKTPGMTDAIIMLKVWLRQRKVCEMKKGESAYSQALPGINGFLLSMVMVLLLQKRKVNAKMSCYQMFKVALDYIAHSDWASTGATLAGAQEGAPDISTFTSQYDVTLVDSSGHYNIAANVPLSAYAELKSEARDSVRVLDSHAQSEDFEALFMNPADYLTRCDGFVHVRALASLNAAFSLDNRTKTDVIADWGYGTPAAVVEKMCALVRRGLGDRVTQLRLRYVETDGSLWTNCDWPVTASSPHAALTPSEHKSTQKHVLFTIGMRMDPNNAYRAIEKGPGPSDASGAQAFRAFWGEESTELRLFKDGAMHETVQFSPTGTLQGTQAHMPYTVCKHVLTRFGIGGHVVDGDDVIAVGPQADLLLSNQLMTSGVDAEETEVNAKSHLLHTYESLSKQLRALRDLPLRVRECVAVAPALRCTSVCVPRPLNKADSSKDVSYYQEAMDVVLVMETSSKWPDDLQAIQHIKAAFNIKLKQLLEADQKTRTKALRGNANPSKQLTYDAHFLDVRVGGRFADVTKGGLTFRLWIKCEREEYLMSTAGESAAVNAYHTQYELRPAHSKAITSIASSHKHYSASVRLFKRWINCQMLSGVFIDEALEIIVAAAFLPDYNPTTEMSDSDASPHSAMAGFLRALELTANHDWTNDVLFVEGMTNGVAQPTLTVAQRQEAQHILTTAVKRGVRASLPPAFLVTSLDGIPKLDAKTGKTNTNGIFQWTSPWTNKEKLTTLLFPRFIALAKAAVQTLRSQLMTSHAHTQSDAERNILIRLVSVFEPNLNEYDALITLNPTTITRANEAVAVSVGASAKASAEVGVESGKKSRKRKYKNLQPLQATGPESVYSSAHLTEVVTGFDPVFLFVEELRREFGHLALFLYNVNGGRHIGVVWGHNAFDKVKFSVMKSRFTSPVDIKEKDGTLTAAFVRIDPQYVLDEVVRMGTGLVESVKAVRLS